MCFIYFPTTKENTETTLHRKVKYVIFMNLFKREFNWFWTFKVFQHFNIMKICI